MGKPPITMDKMDLFVALWVERKGIDKDTVTKIEQLTGSLPRALLMILHALRRYEEPQPHKRRLDLETSDQEVRILKRTRDPEAYDQQIYQQVHAIVKEATEANEKSFSEVLQRLPPMKSERKDTELPLLALPESKASISG